MAHGTNAADARHQRGHLIEWPPFAQLLKASELRYVEARILDAAVFVQMQRDLRMAFDARHRIDDDGAFRLHDVSLTSMVAPASRRLSRCHPGLAVGGETPHDSRRDGGATIHDPKRVFNPGSGFRPASNSDTT